MRECVGCHARGRTFDVYSRESGHRFRLCRDEPRSPTRAVRRGANQRHRRRHSAGVLLRIFDPFFTTKEPAKGPAWSFRLSWALSRATRGLCRSTARLARGTQFKITCGPWPGPPCSAGRRRFIAQRRQRTDLGGGLRGSRAQRRPAHIGDKSATGRDRGRWRRGAGRVSRSREPFQAIMTEMLTPIMDCATLIRALRRLAPSLRLVAMSGLPEINGPPLRRGTPGAFLLKPFNAEDALRSLHKVSGESAGG